MRVGASLAQLEEVVAEEGFRIDSSWLNALEEYAEGLAHDVRTSAYEATDFATQAFVDKARRTPEWEPLADNIQSWSEEGRLVIGVQGRELVSQAMTLEFGNDEMPPNPLFRASSSIARQMQQRFRDSLAAGRPIVIQGMEV